MDKVELSNLLKEIRRFEKKNPKTYDIKIAVLGSCSIQYFVKFLNYFLTKNGIQSKIYEGEYQGIAMDVFQKKSPLYEFSPDFIIILPYYKDIQRIPKLLSPSEIVDAYIESCINYYEKIWTNLKAIEKCRVLQSNIVIPPIRLLGNIETSIYSSHINILRKINEGLVARKYANVEIIDVEFLASNIGKYQWFDFPSFYLNKAGVRLEYLPELVNVFIKQILAIQGNIKKCLVLDLDNTLWGGVIGDDGIDNIILDPNHAVGEAFRSFQEYVSNLKARGILLAICSKNEEAIAKEPFEKHEHMILKLDDISCFMANWEDKASNIRKIAQKLNIGIDSLVFFDDNPAEREIVHQYVPEVTVIDVPTDPALYVLQMEKESPFEWLQITKEDIVRSGSYQSNEEREQLMSCFVNYEDYLKALEMKGCATELEKNDIGRFVQLINKSNQFNLRTIRYTEAEIEKLIHNPEIKCLCIKLSDKFSNYGIISCIILRKQKMHCFIDTWVMSCRVLKRGVEYLTFEAITNAAKELECVDLTSEYIKSKKNIMVENFYETLGFTLKECSGKGIGASKRYINERLTAKIPYYIKKEIL